MPLSAAFSPPAGPNSVVTRQLACCLTQECVIPPLSLSVRSFETTSIHTSTSSCSRGRFFAPLPQLGRRIGRDELGTLRVLVGRLLELGAVRLAQHTLRRAGSKHTDQHLAPSCVAAQFSMDACSPTFLAFVVSRLLVALSYLPSFLTSSVPAATRCAYTRMRASHDFAVARSVGGGDPSSSSSRYFWCCCRSSPRFFGVVLSARHSQCGTDTSVHPAARSYKV